MALLLQQVSMLLPLACIILATAWVWVTANLIYRLFSIRALPKHLPWAGTGSKQGCLARAKANLASFFRLRELLDEGYQKVRR